MKRLILGFSMLSLLALNAQAQDIIEIRRDGTGADISGGTVSVDLWGTSPDVVDWTPGVNVQYNIHFVVKNTSASNQQWTITRRIIEAPSVWEDQVCWPPNCYSASGEYYTTPNTGLNPAPTIVAGTDQTTNSALAEISAKIYPTINSAAYAHYRYYVTSAANGTYLDSVDVKINYVLSTPAIKQAPVLTVSPNPATDNVTISLGTAANANLKIVDALGKVIMVDEITDGTKTINLSNFKNGVYFIFVESSEIKGLTRKLIVRH